MAWIPLLGRGAFMVDAETAQDAINELEELRRSRYDMVIESGQTVPIPDDSDEEPLPSGKWLVRTTPVLHRKLQEAAAAQNVSLNAYCNQALERAVTADLLGGLMDQVQRLAAALERSTRLAKASSELLDQSNTALLRVAPPGGPEPLPAQTGPG